MACPYVCYDSSCKNKTIGRAERRGCEVLVKGVNCKVMNEWCVNTDVKLQCCTPEMFVYIIYTHKHNNLTSTKGIPLAL